MNLRAFILAVSAAALLPRVAVAHGDLHESIERVSAAIVAQPDDAALFLRRAELHRLHGDWAVALADYSRARKLRPGLSIVDLGIARMHAARGRDRAAFAVLNTFLGRNPDHADARALRAEVAERLGRWRQSDADLAAAFAASGEPHLATERARLLERHESAEAAVRSLDEASGARGGVPLLEEQALEIEVRSGRVAAALARVEAFIAREPRPDRWWVRKAELLERSGRPGEARTAWRAASSAFERVPPEKREAGGNRELAGRIARGLQRPAASER